jgi:hypothetical protein
MRKDDLRYMLKTRSHLGDKGMSFQNAFVSNPFAAPQEPPSCAASTPTTPAYGSTVALRAAGKRVENMREFPRLMVRYSACLEWRSRTIGSMLVSRLG